MTKLWTPGMPRSCDENPEDRTIPDDITRDMLSEIFFKFVDDHLYDTKQFLRHFQNRRAVVELPYNSILDLVKNSVCYDEQNQFDLRILYACIAPMDKKLFIDLATQVSERFVNNPNTPKSPLTLMQFKVLLAYRMSQIGF